MFLNFINFITQIVAQLFQKIKTLGQWDGSKTFITIMNQKLNIIFSTVISSPIH